MRISCAGLVRITDDKGRFAVLVHHKSSRPGSLSLSPIGGALKIKPEGFSYLQAAVLDWEVLELESGNDLRFIIQDNHANAIRDWFQARWGRETQPMRELIEELVQETRILTQNDLSNVRFRLAGFYQEELPSIQPKHKGVTTLRLIEVFDTICHPATVKKLLEAAEAPAPEIYFVTADEINTGHTAAGHVFTSVSKALLVNKQG